MKAQLYFLMMLIISASTFADDTPDGQRKIKMNFEGDVVLPSCVIEFEGKGNAWSEDFNEVNVSDIRYYTNGTITPEDDKFFSKQISRDAVIKISGCAANQLNTDVNGKQIVFTIVKNGNANWLNDGGYMAGALVPTTGATDYAVKFMVPDASAGAISDSPTLWKTLTDPSVTSGSVDSRIGQTGVTSAYEVALSDLIAVNGSGSDAYWKLPVRMNLGMASKMMAGKNMGELNVSATITASYY